MAVNPERALVRARFAYERARLMRAAVFVLPLAALAALAYGLGAKPSTSLGVGTALVSASWLFLWRGQTLGSAVPWGAFAGLFPLALAFGARSFGHVCTGAQCVSLCVPACTVGGIAAGLLVARAGRNVSSKATFFAAAGSVAALVGALGCSCVGYGGVAGLAAGLSLTLFPALLRRTSAT